MHIFKSIKATKYQQLQLYRFILISFLWVINETSMQNYMQEVNIKSRHTKDPDSSSEAHTWFVMAQIELCKCCILKKFRLIWNLEIKFFIKNPTNSKQNTNLTQLTLSDFYRVKII